MEKIQLQPVAGTYADQFEARVGESVVGVIGWKELADMTTSQLAEIAPSSIRLKDGSSLVVYERRTSPGLESSEDALRIEVNDGCIQLSPQSARELASTLLAYAGQQNRRWQWLVRVESGQG